MTDSAASTNVPYVENIRRSGFSIYDRIEIGDPDLWIPSPELERLLRKSLCGMSLSGLPLRTRSKVAKSRVCEALGYPVPTAFRKSQPRFPGQFFDTYVQKSNNLQVWNEELSPTRRYVLIRLSSDDVITDIKVVTGDTLAKLDTTGTLTQKYQARCVVGIEATELISPLDTSVLRPFTTEDVDLRKIGTPVDYPATGTLLSIAALYARLAPLVGCRFRDTGRSQDRNRGAALHRMVCAALGYANYQDDGQFPDVRHQLLEVKLQTSPTIDLGLVLPSSAEPLDVPQIAHKQLRHCDVRYAVFYAKTDNVHVTLTHLLLTAGEAFFTRFVQFQGKVLNRKLQIPLPADFFSETPNAPQTN